MDKTLNPKPKPLSRLLFLGGIEIVEDEADNDFGQARLCCESKAQDQARNLNPKQKSLNPEP